MCICGINLYFLSIFLSCKQFLSVIILFSLCLHTCTLHKHYAHIFQFWGYLHLLDSLFIFVKCFWKETALFYLQSLKRHCKNFCHEQENPFSSLYIYSVVLIVFFVFNFQRSQGFYLFQHKPCVYFIFFSSLKVIRTNIYIRRGILFSPDFSHERHFLNFQEFSKV